MQSLNSRTPIVEYISTSILVILFLILVFAPNFVMAAEVYGPPCESRLSRASDTARATWDWIKLSTTKWTAPQGVLASQMMSQNFYEPSEKGAVVGVSGYVGLRARINASNGNFLSGQPFADNLNVFHLDVTGTADFFLQLKSVYDKRGPIYRLAILGHGMPGSIALGESSFDQEWVRRNVQYLASLPDDLFAPNAEIVLLSCNCSQGEVFSPEKGVEQIRSIFSKFVRQGAKIVASRRLVFGTTAGFESSPEVLEVQVEQRELQRDIRMRIIRGSLEILMRGYFAMANLFDMILLDEKSKTDIIDIIQIPPAELSPTINHSKN